MEEGLLESHRFFSPSHYDGSKTPVIYYILTSSVQYKVYRGFEITRHQLNLASVHQYINKWKASARDECTVTPATSKRTEKWEQRWKRERESAHRGPEAQQTRSCAGALPTRWPWSLRETRTHILQRTRASVHAGAVRAHAKTDTYSSRRFLPFSHLHDGSWMIFCSHDTQYPVYVTWHPVYSARKGRAEGYNAKDNRDFESQSVISVEVETVAFGEPRD